MYNQMDKTAVIRVYCQKISKGRTMADKSVILDKISNYGSFARSDMQVVMEECGYYATESIANHMIAGMLTDGDIARVGRNRYCVADPLRSYCYPHSEFASSIAGEIMAAHPYLDFRIFELVQLNEFVNHQIAHNIVFVSVEGDLEEFVFDTLWGNHKGSVLLKPDANDLFRYMTDNMIVIIKLPTESPRGTTAFWDTRIEKMLVDVAVDKLLRRVVDPGEYPAIYQDAFHKYAIDKSAMFRYARRRGAIEKYRSFLVSEAGLKPEDIEI